MHIYVSKTFADKPIKLKGKFSRRFPLLEDQIPRKPQDEDELSTTSNARGGAGLAG